MINKKRRIFLKATLGALTTAVLFKKLDFSALREPLKQSNGSDKKENHMTDFIDKHARLGSLVTISGGPNAMTAKLKLAHDYAKQFIDSRTGELYLTDTIDREGIIEALKMRTADAIWVIESNDIQQNDWYGSDQGSKLVDFARENSIIIVLTLTNNYSDESVSSIKIEDGMAMGKIPFKQFRT